MVAASDCRGTVETRGNTCGRHGREEWVEGSEKEGVGGEGPCEGDREGESSEKEGNEKEGVWGRAVRKRK